jgi:hypothetical protein
MWEPERRERHEERPGNQDSRFVGRLVAVIGIAGLAAILFNAGVFDRVRDLLGGFEPVTPESPAVQSAPQSPEPAASPPQQPPASSEPAPGNQAVLQTDTLRIDECDQYGGGSIEFRQCRAREKERLSAWCNELGNQGSTARGSAYEGLRQQTTAVCAAAERYDIVR